MVSDYEFSPDTYIPDKQSDYVFHGHFDASFNLIPMK
jgi:hypothetical protein